MYLIFPYKLYFTYNCTWNLLLCTIRGWPVLRSFLQLFINHRDVPARWISKTLCLIFNFQCLGMDCIYQLPPLQTFANKNLSLKLEETLRFDCPINNSLDLSIGENNLKLWPLLSVKLWFSCWRCQLWSKGFRILSPRSVQINGSSCLRNTQTLLSY